MEDKPEKVSFEPRYYRHDFPLQYTYSDKKQTQHCKTNIRILHQKLKHLPVIWQLLDHSEVEIQNFCR